MSAILLITLQKDSQQIDLTLEDWFLDLVFISFENLHIRTIILWRKKKCSKKEISGNIIIIRQIFNHLESIWDLCLLPSSASA